MNDVHFSSLSNEWETPPDLFKKYDDIFHFQLDAAATKENALCPSFFTKEDNSLTKDWYPFKSIWLNPPYGREIGHFIRKAYEESVKGCVVVCLIPARTDTAYFHDYCLPYGKIEFLRGRVKFRNRGITTKSQSAPFPSCIVVFNGLAT